MEIVQREHENQRRNQQNKKFTSHKFFSLGTIFLVFMVQNLSYDKRYSLFVPYEVKEDKDDLVETVKYKQLDGVNLNLQFMYFITFSALFEFCNPRKWIIVSCFVFGVLNLIIFAIGVSIDDSF